MILRILFVLLGPTCILSMNQKYGKDINNYNYNNNVDDNVNGNHHQKGHSTSKGWKYPAVGENTISESSTQYYKSNRNRNDTYTYNYKYNYSHLYNHNDSDMDSDNERFKYNYNYTRRNNQEQSQQGSLIIHDGALYFVMPSMLQGEARGHQYNNTNENNNDDNDTTTANDNNNSSSNNSSNGDILRPQGDDDNPFQEVDCSRFLDWDDPPPECLSQFEFNEGNGDNNGDDNGDDDHDDDENENTFQPGYEGGQEEVDDNMVMTDTEIATGLTGETLAPFVDEEEGENQGDARPENLVTVQISVGLAKDPSNLDQLNQIVSQVVTILLDELTPFHLVYLGNLNPPENIRRLSSRMKPFSRRQLTSGYSNNNNNDDESDNENESPQRPPVDLLHAWTIIEPTPFPSDLSEFWYWTRIEYAAFVRYQDEDSNSPKPIRKQDNIGNITLLCQSTINRTVTNGVLVHQLEDAINEVFDSTRINATLLQGDLSLLGVAPIGLTGQGKATYVVDLHGHDRISYTEPLELGFGIREWLGLSLAVFTVLVATFLFLGGLFLQRRHAQKQWSTAVMTEEGITDILQVGWRYQATTQPNGPQLFLQLFEKPLFRSDDDSLLQGGVEREELAHTGGLAVYDEGSREDDSSSSNRQSSSRASAERKTTIVSSSSLTTDRDDCKPQPYS